MFKLVLAGSFFMISGSSGPPGWDQYLDFYCSLDRQDVERVAASHHWNIGPWTGNNLGGYCAPADNPESPSPCKGDPTTECALQY